MIDIHDARISTAGAYVYLEGVYPFALGSRPAHGRLPVIRLGGHREDGETGWQCAAREVMEEAGLCIRRLVPRDTYLCDGDHLDAPLDEILWDVDAEERRPLLVTAYRRETGLLLSLMYLAEAEGPALPSSEVHGLLLLGPEEIHQLCDEELSLESYLRSGGRAVLKADFDPTLILEPFIQLRMFSRILTLQPELRAI